MKNIKWIKIFFLISFFINLLFSNIVFANNNNLLKVEYFYGVNCNHCEKIKPFMAEIKDKYKNEIQLKEYEIFQDKFNYFYLRDLIKMLGYKEEDIGTPTIIVDNVALIGDDDIVLNLESTINEKKNNLIENQIISKTVTMKGEDNYQNNLNFEAITLAAFADSVNPCAMMVLIVLLSSLIVYNRNNKRKIIFTTISFILAVYITYFSIGLGFTYILNCFNFSKMLTIIVGIIALLIGLANIKDGLFYRAGKWAIEIPEKWRNNLLNIILKATSPMGAFISGMIVTLFELPCTGGPYLFALSLLANNIESSTRLLMICYYNLIFILPLIIIAFLVIQGYTTIEKAENVRNKYTKEMHLIAGIIMCILGIWTLLYLN